MASSKAVNVPTNTRIKEQDVNAKLQLYGIYQGLSLTPLSDMVRMWRKLS